MIWFNEAQIHHSVFSGIQIKLKIKDHVRVLYPAYRFSCSLHAFWWKYLKIVAENDKQKLANKSYLQKIYRYKQHTVVVSNLRPETIKQKLQNCTFFFVESTFAWRSPRNREFLSEKVFTDKKWGLTVCIRRGEERTFASQRGRIQARNEGQPLDASKPRKTKNRPIKNFKIKMTMCPCISIATQRNARRNRMHSLRYTVEERKWSKNSDKRGERGGSTYRKFTKES